MPKLLNIRVLLVFAIFRNNKSNCGISIWTLKWCSKALHLTCCCLSVPCAVSPSNKNDYARFIHIHSLKRWVSYLKTRRQSAVKAKFNPLTFGSVDKCSHQLSLIFNLNLQYAEFKSLNLCLDIPLLQCWRQVWAAPCRWPTGVYEDHSYAPIWFWYRDFVHFLNLNVRSCAVNLKPGVQSSVFWRVFYAMTEVDVLSVGHKP